MSESAPDEEAESGWCGIPEAADALGMAVRTAYAKAKGLPKRKGPHGALIRLADLKAATRDRRVAAAIVPYRAAAAAARSSGSGNSGSPSFDGIPELAAIIKKEAGAKAPLDGETQSAVLKRFEAAVPPVQVQIETRIPIDRVMELYEQWKRAREETEPPANPLAALIERLAALEREFVRVRDQQVDPMSVDIYQLKQDHFELAKGIRNIVLSRLERLEQGQAHLTERIKQLNERLWDLEGDLRDLQSPLRLLPP